VCLVIHAIIFVSKEGTMKNMIRLVVMVVAAGLLISGAVYAASDMTASSTEQKKTTVIDVGNKICPVMGGEVDGKTFYVYKGKRYSLCCPGCDATFASDPEKYSAIADKEVAGKK
jgi:YHS domain-containing protein